jgi:hypothetical protein
MVVGVAGKALVAESGAQQGDARDAGDRPKLVVRDARGAAHHSSVAERRVQDRSKPARDALAAGVEAAQRHRFLRPSLAAGGESNPP